MIPDDLDVTEVRRAAARLLAEVRADTLYPPHDRFGMGAVYQAAHRAKGLCANYVRVRGYHQASLYAYADQLLGQLHARAYQVWDARYQAERAGQGRAA